MNNDNLKTEMRVEIQISDTKSDHYIKSDTTWRHEETGRFLNNVESYFMDALFKRDNHICTLQTDKDRLLGLFNNMNPVITVARIHAKECSQGAGALSRSINNLDKYVEKSQTEQLELISYNCMRCGKPHWYPDDGMPVPDICGICTNGKHHHEPPTLLMDPRQVNCWLWSSEKGICKDGLRCINVCPAWTPITPIVGVDMATGIDKSASWISNIRELDIKYANWSDLVDAMMALIESAVPDETLDEDLWDDVLIAYRKVVPEGRVAKSTLEWRVMMTPNRFQMGDRVSDKISGFIGIVVAVILYMFDTPQYQVCREDLEEGNKSPDQWFQEGRLNLVADADVVAAEKKSADEGEPGIPAGDADPVEDTDAEPAADAEPTAGAEGTEAEEV